MSLSWRIKPFPMMVDPNLKVIEEALPRDFARYVRSLGDDLIATKGAEPGRVGYNEASMVVPARRQAETQWFPFPWDDERTGDLYLAVEEALQQANALFWQRDITDFEDMFHYIRYPAAPDHGPDCLCGEGHDTWIPDGHFDWHRDSGDQWRRAPRKLSLTLVLSDPEEYEGGEFQFFDGGPITVAPRRMGDMIVFPSDLQHRVTPVTKGMRRSMVAWAAGPRPR